MAKKMTFQVESHVDEVNEAVEKAVYDALELMGQKIEDHAKEYTPVDTGRLRNSITHTRGDGWTEIVGTDVEYAAHVEFTEMSHKVGKSHYLRDGAQNHVDELRDIAQTTLEAKLS